MCAFTKIKPVKWEDRAAVKIEPHEKFLLYSSYRLLFSSPHSQASLSVQNAVRMRLPIIIFLGITNDFYMDNQYLKD